MSDNEKTVQSWNTVVYGRGFWGCGNSWSEACLNANEAAGFNPVRDNYMLLLFSEPVVNVSAGFRGVSYEWVDAEGVCVTAEIIQDESDWGEEV